MDSFWLREMILRTLRDPRGAAQALLTLNLPREARFIALGVVMALSASFGMLAEILFSFVTKVDLGPVTTPVPMAMVQGALMLYGAFAMSFFGRQFGGTGRFDDALLLVVWIEFMLIAGQVLQLLIMVFFPMVSVLGTLVLFGLMFWLLIQFTAVLHGFTNMTMVGAGVLAVFFGSAMVLGALMLSLGIVPPMVITQ